MGNRLGKTKNGKKFILPSCHSLEAQKNGIGGLSGRNEKLEMKFRIKTKKSRPIPLWMGIGANPICERASCASARGKADLVRGLPEH